MSAAEWWDSGDIDLLLSRARGPGKWYTLNFRQQQLLALAWCGRIRTLADKEVARLLGTVERHVEGAVTDVGLRQQQGKATRAALELGLGSRGVDHRHCANRACLLAANWHDSLTRLSHQTVYAYSSPSSPGLQTGIEIAERGVQAGLLRDVVGDPFRPIDEITYEPATKKYWVEFATENAKDVSEWFQDPVPRLALAAYRQCNADYTLNPEQLLVLADALEDKGCREESLLWHLRGYEPCATCFRGTHGNEEACGGRGSNGRHGYTRLKVPHVRGCWAVELFLEK